MMKPDQLANKHWALVITEDNVNLNIVIEAPLVDIYWEKAAKEKQTRIIYEHNSTNIKR